MAGIKPEALFSLIPSVDKILSHPSIQELLNIYSPILVKHIITGTLNDLRDLIRKHRLVTEDLALDVVVDRIILMVEHRLAPKLCTLINATGIVVHTNLGRSPLSRKVAQRIFEAAISYSNLEYDLEKGKRGQRNAHLRSLMKELTGAEAVLAVNNNAAAVLLALGTLAKGKEVIVSRGELIEIGGSFRIPEVMAQSGAILKEVGATNRTHPRDYVKAINDNTALILKVHTSNYRIVGFTREITFEELVQIGQEHNLPTMMDLGSGCLVDLAPFGLPDEVTVQEVLSKGIDVVSFSGDKLLGGPQAGILAGKKELIERMATNPLARALRMDKLTLAGLEATLQEYAHAWDPSNSIPTLTMIRKTQDELMIDAEKIASSLESGLQERAQIFVEQGVGRVGGGALPMSDLVGPRVGIKPESFSAGRLEGALRQGHPPVITMVKEDCVLIDPRTLLENQAETIPELVIEAFKLVENSKSSCNDPGS
ncbi:MAG: L-seryl-tRNA(Sec) selenium transferase [Deltaproteobacteria bacterium]|nr:L-seryl-tRNA(Sec) selenium transferase [Deltaproteobacteria bacterium]